ncbi:MAG: chorismate mutase [Sneathiella sp.]|nr:chorismate mutase [Sneathiella sp.]
MNKLEILRKDIDKTDAQLIHLLGKRFALTKKVGQFKANNATGSIDVEREKAVLAKWEKLAIKNGVDEILAQKIARLIIDSVVENHDRLKELE